MRPSGFDGRPDRGAEGNGAASRRRSPRPTAIASRCWSRAMWISGRCMSCAPSPGEVTHRVRSACRPSCRRSISPCGRCARCSTNPEVTELCINRPREAFIETRARLACAKSCPFADFDWCRRLAKLIANVTRQRVDESSPLLSASLPRGRARPDRAAAGDHARLRRDHDPAAGRRAVWSIEELPARRVSARRCPPASTPEDTDSELLRLHAAGDYAALHAPRGARPQEHPRLRRHRLGQDHLDQGADPRDPGRRAPGHASRTRGSWCSIATRTTCGCTTARTTRGSRA